MEQKYAEYAAQKAVELLAIDSPTGFTDRAAAWVQDAFGALGFAAKKTAKGGVLIDLGGAESEEGALLRRRIRTRSARWSRRSRPTAVCA